MRKWKPYHDAWLSAHPTRTEGWLRDRLAEGFDIHHLDGNHDNNDPPNLVLIEHEDHLRLHGAPGNRLAAVKAFRERPRKDPGALSTQQIEADRWSQRKREERERRLAALPPLD